jgi:predicted ferric reductase
MNRRPVPALLLVGLYIIFPAGFTALYFIGNLYSFEAIFEAYNLSIIAGAVAYILFMSQFLLSARLRFIERLFAQDKLLAAHGTMGMVTAGLVLAHFILKYLTILRYGTFTVQSLLGFAALLIYAALTPAALLVLQGRARNKKKSPPYERNRKLHNFFVLAGILAVIHVYLATSTWTLALKLSTLIWGLACLGAYAWHKIIRPGKAKKLKLDEVVTLTPEISAYRFSAEEELPRRRSGQFGYFRFTSDPPGGEEHPFTISSAAKENIEIIAKVSGDYTDEMRRSLTNTEVLFDGPYGRFFPDMLPDGTRLYFIAGGIGITPFLSMIRDEELRESFPMSLIWSVRTPEDEKSAPALSELAARNKIELRMVYTRQAPQGEEPGRITADLLERSISSEDIRTSPVFLCGPQGFGREIRSALRSLGIPRSAIHEEKFSW